MVMRSISELLDDSSSHVSLAVPRNLKEGSPPPSSSSDSEEDIDELPFIPMPQTMMFSGSRMSLTEIHEDDVDVIRGSNESYQENMNRLEDITECQTTDGQRDVDHLEIAERTVNLKDSFQRGSSVEAEQVAGKSRRALMRRGSSADSALLLQITPEDDNMNNTTEEVQKHMQKAVSMELPHSSNSPKTGRLSKEDYALKLDLMRQRLLKRGTVDKNMSGLRGPLLESLGVDNERRTASLDRNFTRAKLSASEVPRAFSSNCPEDTCPNTAFRKRSSLSDRNSESISLHRRSGAPLEIPSIFSGDHNLLDATSPLSEQTKDGPKPVFPREISFKPPTPDIENKQASKEEAIGAIQSMNTSQPASILDDNDKKVEKMEGHMFSEDCVPGKINKSTESSLDILPHDISSNYSSKLHVNGKKASSVAVLPTPMLKISEPDIQPTTGHPVVYASASSAYHPTLRTDIKDIDSEEIFEARFKKRESSLTHGLKRLTRTKSEENSPVLPRKSNEEVYRPRPVGAPLEFRPRGLKEKSKSVQDLREVEKEPRLGVIGRFSMRAKKLQSKKGKEETSDSEANRRHVTGAMGRSKSLDKKEVEIGSSDNTMETEKENLEKNTKKVAESPVLAVRRKFESNVSGIFDRVHSKSKDIKDRETKPHSDEETLKEESQDIKKISDSPVLALRKKFESKVSGFSFRKQSQSDKSEGEKEVKNEEQKTPLFSRHRRSQSDGLIHKSVNNPENQTPSQTASTSSKETLISSSSSHSIQSSQTPESDIRSRWDRWGLSRGKRDRTPSKSNAPEIQKADFPPVFHITLKDHVLLEGNPVTLSCLPAGSPEPNILWIKDKKPLEINDRMSLVACPDGRQLLMIMKTSKKDAGIYECVASNNLASATSSCILSIACVPKRPGTPEIPQIYNNTALVQWKPSDSKVPCTYTLEKKCDGDDKWVTEATGVTDCFYNSSVFPTGSTIQFRVACVNKAGQGPYSNVSKGVRINVEVPPLCQPAEMKIHPLSPFSVAAVTTSASTLAEPSVSQSISSIPAQSVDVTNTSSEVPVSHFCPKMSIPPLVHPKPTSTINVVTPVTQTQTVSARSYTAPPSIGRSISPVPSYVPATCSVAPTPISPPVILVNSISPIGEGASSPTQETPMERVVSTTKTETTLKQGVPQKPYSFFDEKARGRFGVIRDCRENSTGKMFIAKIIPYDQQAKQAVIKEYEILKSLRCERIMALHEAYITPRYLVLITEYCTGKEILYSLIERFCYSEDDVVGFIVQILQGLEYLHNCRILHLDIKPDNIMVTNLNVIKIIDFGSAQRFNPLSLKQYSRELGTLEYMAPELLKGDLVGPPADIWSLGVLSYIMLSGRLPFQDKDPKLTETKIHAAKFDSTKLYPKVSQSASTFLKKTLNGYPWCRPTIKDCLNHSWLHDSYLKKLRRQTLTFTTTRLKEFLEEHQRRCAESATKHQVLLRVYQSGSSSPASPTKPSSPSTPISEEKH